ncbi:hypothetical protein [Kitasatospora sp. NPDC096204]
MEYLRLGLGRPPEDGSQGPGSAATVILDRAQAELSHATRTEWPRTRHR